LHKSYSPGDLAQIETDCRTAKIGCVECKKLFAERLIAALTPFQERRAALAADPALVPSVLADGAKRAHAIAEVTLREVKEKIGLL
jgi:tryptophanyl-tRNA synthetase